MNICILDYKTDNEWSKNWSTLQNNYVKIDVLEEKWITYIPKETVLIVVHHSSVSKAGCKTDADFIRKYTNKEFQPYTLFVSSDILDGSSSDDGIAHYSKVPFPEDQSLELLLNPLEELCSELGRIFSKERESIRKERLSAWQKWDMHAQGTVQNSLLLLCQGYLAIFSGTNAFNKLNNSNRQQFIDVLINIGWFNKSTKKHFNELKKLFPDDIEGKFKEISKNEWWINPFGGKNSLKDALDNEYILDDKLKEKIIVNLSKPKVEPKTVLDLYNKLVNSLGHLVNL